MLRSHFTKIEQSNIKNKQLTYLKRLKNSIYCYNNKNKFRIKESCIKRRMNETYFFQETQIS